MKPLDDLLVLDLSRVLAGPFCTMALADMGARVIKVEHPKGGDETRRFGPPFVGGESTYFLSINRGKRSLALDFKHPEGRAVLLRLLDQADVLLENFRPGALERQDLGPAACLARNPRLIADAQPIPSSPAGSDHLAGGTSARCVPAASRQY